MGNMMDPLKSGFLPMTEEIYTTQKKIRKESGIEKSIAETSKDLSFLSPQANEELKDMGAENFMDNTAGEISQLNPASEKFMQEAIGKLISSALEQEFGKGVTSDKGFEKMKDELTCQMLGDPDKMVVIENYISLLQKQNKINLSE